jgi:pyruvate kinase
MLSAESAAGKYPVQSIRMMANIILESERHSADWGHHNILQADILNNDAVVISHAARDMAQDKNVSAIVVFTRSGKSALWISKTKPNVPIFAFTPEASTYQWLGICWGVTPFRVPHADTLETMVTHVETALTAATPLKGGDQVVIISGFPVGAFTSPNLALLYTLKG